MKKCSKCGKTGHNKRTCPAEDVPYEWEIILDYDEHITGGEPESDEKWCNYTDQNTEFELKYAYIKRSDCPSWIRETKTIDFDPAEVDHVYVLVVRYSSGNTFGSTYGEWSIEGVYKSFAEANAIKETIPDNYAGYACWEGYFECFEEVSIECVHVMK